MNKNKKDFIAQVNENHREYIDDTLNYLKLKKTIRDKKWYQDNREKLRKSILKYQKTEKCKISRLKRRENVKNSFKNLSKEEKKDTKNFYKNKPNGYVVDHIVPLSKGGTSHISNLQYLTLEENSKKRY